MAEFGSRAFKLSNSKKWNSKNFKIPDWLINPGKSLQIQLRAIAYRKIINHGASRTHFWSFKYFQNRYWYVSLLYRYSRHLSWLNWHFSTITWFFIPRMGFLHGQNKKCFSCINQWHGLKEEGYWQYDWILKHNLEIWPSIWKHLLTWRNQFEFGPVPLRRIHDYSLGNIGRNLGKSTITWKRLYLLENIDIKSDVTNLTLTCLS